VTDSRTAAAGRAVEVYRPTGTGGYVMGTGFLLDGGLALTAGHVAGPAGGRVLVRVPGRAEPWTCTVLWHRHDEPHHTGVDAALLRIDDPGFRPPRALPPLGWGRLAGTRGGRRVEAVGFPAGMELLTGHELAFRDTAHAIGEITPGSRLKAGRYEIRVHTPVPPARPRAPRAAAPSPAAWNGPVSRWSGMSGAGVVCEGLLVGLVGVDPGDPTGGALTAVPVQSVLADREAARLLGGVRPQSVELAPVVLPPPAPPASPAGLLRAEVSPVGCRGRDDLIDGLTDWCGEPGEFSLRLLTAAGGQGKTRLARELVERMSDRGWAAGFLDDQCPNDRLSGLAGLAEPLLLVVDYAETRPEQLRRCLRALRPGTGGGCRVRLLLLARGAGEWWRQVRAATRALRELPAGAVHELEPLAPDERSRAAAFRRCVEELAPALAALPGSPDGMGTAPATVPYTASDSGGRGPLPAAVSSAPRLAARRYSGALALNMAALIALLERDGPASGRAGRAEEEVLLLHEERYWTQTATAHGIGHLHPATLRQLVAGATLHRAGTPAEARNFLADLGCMGGETANVRLAAAVWLHELYGGQDGYWTGLSPDPLGAHQVGSTLRDFPELLAEIADRAPRDRAGHLLRVLCRARDAFPELRERIIALVTARPRPLAFAAVDLIVQEADETLVAALDAVLADAAAGEPSDRGLPADLLAVVPRHTEILARQALGMARQSVARLRAAPDTAPPRLADALLALAYRLSGTGHHREAVAAAEEALRLRSGAGTAELIDVLLGYGARLDEVGRHEKAARIGDRLLALPCGDPDQQARILHHHACWCHRAGRSAEALDLGERSVALRRRLAARDPGRLPEELAGSLLNHALYLQAAGVPEAAEEPLREAVATLRRLVEESPDGYLAALGRALHDQGRLHAALRMPDRALACAEEAAAIHRTLAGAGASPPRTADLAAVLVGLAARLTEAGRSGEALDALAEAVVLRRTLAADGGPAATGRLAVALTDHAVLLRQTGRSADGERLTDEAVRVLTAARTAGWRPAGPTAARILMHRGLALTARDPAAAGEFLRRAAADAVRSGATALADRCAAELASLGGKAAAPTTR
jgi:tetratricopeptide (TPR) repeat protein